MPRYDYKCKKCGHIFENVTHSYKVKKETLEGPCGTCSVERVLTTNFQKKLPEREVETGDVASRLIEDNREILRLQKEKRKAGLYVD